MSRVDRLKALIEQYGKFALVLHFVVYFLSIGVFTLLAHFGLGQAYAADLDPTAVPGAGWLQAQLGTFGLALAAGYGVTQLLKIPRFALTLALTPLLARRLGYAPP